MLSNRVNRIGMSPTMKMAGMAKSLAAQGHDVIDLSVGEPDFPTPEYIVKACKTALDKGQTKYTANAGLPELKKAIIEKLQKENGVAYQPDEILISPGAKTSLYNLSVALFDDGDEVVIPAPYWVTYIAQVQLAKATPIVIQTDEKDDFKLRPEALKQALTPKTKAIFINSPSNPTGAVYSQDELRPLAELAADRGMAIISDEIYEKILFDGVNFACTAAFSEKIKAHTIVVNGFSKAFAMTGWRLGYAAGPKSIIAAMEKVQSHNTSNATTFVQHAGVTALRELSNQIDQMVVEFQKRRDLVVKLLREIPSVTVSAPEGAFYVFPNIKRYLGRIGKGRKIATSVELSEYILEETKVATVPGDAFGTDGFIRLSFATSQERIRAGISRIAAALEKLS